MLKIVLVVSIMRLEIHRLPPLTDRKFRVYDVVYRRVEEHLDVVLGGSPSFILGHTAAGKTTLITTLYALPMHILYMEGDAFIREIFDDYRWRCVTGYLHRKDYELIIRAREGEEIILDVSPEVAKKLGLDIERITLSRVSITKPSKIIDRILVSFLSCCIVGIPEYVHLVPLTDVDTVLKGYRVLCDYLCELWDVQFNVFEWYDKFRKAREGFSYSDALVAVLSLLSLLPRCHPYYLARVIAEDVLPEDIAKGLGLDDVVKQVERLVEDITGRRLALDDSATYLSTGINTITYMSFSTLMAPKVFEIAQEILNRTGIQIDLVMGPILFLDEPFSGLPLSTAIHFWTKMYSMIMSINIKKLFVVTHRFECFGDNPEYAPKEIVVLLRNTKAIATELSILKLVDPVLVDGIRVDREFLESEDIVARRLRQAIEKDFG